MVGVRLGSITKQFNWIRWAFMSIFDLRPSKPAPRPVVRKNDDYNPSVNRPTSVPNKRPDRDRGMDKGGRKPSAGPSNKPSRDARSADRGRGAPKGEKDKGAANKDQKVSFKV